MISRPNLSFAQKRIVAAAIEIVILTIGIVVGILMIFGYLP
jgi:hypothetical protein